MKTIRPTVWAVLFTAIIFSVFLCRYYKGSDHQQPAAAVQSNEPAVTIAEVSEAAPAAEEKVEETKIAAASVEIDPAKAERDAMLIAMGFGTEGGHSVSLEYQEKQEVNAVKNQP